MPFALVRMVAFASRTGAVKAASIARRREALKAVRDAHNSCESEWQAHYTLCRRGISTLLKGDILTLLPQGEHQSRASEVCCVQLIWFQTADRVTADEYTVRFRSMADIVRQRRSDSSLVRIIVPIAEVKDEPRALKTAARFARALYRRLCQWFPPL